VVHRESRRIGAPIDQLIALGGLRRYAPLVDRVSLLAVVDAGAHERALDALAGLGGRTSVLARSSTRIALTTERGPVEIFMSAPEHVGAALGWHTGTAQHLSMLRDRGRQRGLRFDEAMLFLDGKPLECPTEEAFFAHLGLPYLAPELREGHDELEAADRDALPQLVTRLHVRGDLHCHTTWSDGRDSVRQMIETARDLGHEFLAITDHSQRSAAARTLAAGDIERQREEVDAARALAPALTVLHGVEVEILADGQLDFDDVQLESFDIVIASLHDAAGQEPEVLLARYVRAMEHPLVSVITHPANRQPATHDGYDLDFDRLFEAAVRTGTALEIDGAPGHLDLDGALARRAAAAGVTLVIDSDAHRAEALAPQLAFGIGTARRGWVEPHQVLNARGTQSVTDFIRRKRSRA
jgi:DNA polymerase (family 10)